MFQKGRKLLEADELRQKVDLEVRFLSRLEELQKAWEVSGLQEKVASAQSDISSL